MIPAHLAVLTLLLVPSPRSRPVAGLPQGQPEAKEISAEEAAKLPLRELLARQPPTDFVGTGSYTRVNPLIVELIHRARSGRLTDEEWRVALTDTDAIHTRRRWPLDVPLQLAIRSDGWLRKSQIVVRAVEPDLGEVEFDNRHPARCGNCDESRRVRAQHLTLARVPAGTRQVRFEVIVRQNDGAEQGWSNAETDRLLWKGLIERPIELVSDPADALPTTNDAAIGDAVRACLGVIRARGDREEDLIVRFACNYDEVPALRGLGLSFEVELWNAQDQKATLRVVPRDPGEFIVPRWSRASWDNVAGFGALVDRPAGDLSSWQLRVRGDSTGVWSQWDAERWWSGSFALPLAEAIEHGKR